MTLAFFSFALLAGTEGAPGALMNRAKPIEPEVVRLEELWRVGDDENGDVVFGDVSGMVVDHERQVYVLDGQATQISVFSPDGRFLRTIGRIGEGPGEFRAPRALVVMPNGSIGVVREEPPAIVRYRATDGSFLDNFTFTADPQHPFQRLHSVACRGRTLVAYVSEVSESPEGIALTARLLRFDTAGKFLEECDTSSYEFQFANPHVKERYDFKWVVGPDDRVIVNRDLNYNFDVYGVGGRGPSFGRGYEPLKRTAAELDSVKAYYRRVGNMGSATLELFDRVRDVAWFAIDDQNRVWVLSSRGRADAPNDSLGLFDVYEPPGALRRTIDLKGEGGPRDRYFMLGNRFFVVQKETMTVIAYRFNGL